MSLDLIELFVSHAQVMSFLIELFILMFEVLSYVWFLIRFPCVLRGLVQYHAVHEYCHFTFMIIYIFLAVLVILILWLPLALVEHSLFIDVLYMLCGLQI